MKPPIVRASLSSVIACSLLTACAFFEQPVDDLTPLTAPAPQADAGNLPPPPPVNPPPLPSAEASGNTPASSQAAGSSAGTYLTVSSIFDIPEDVGNLAFVHFTDRDKGRETAICKALLGKLSITQPSEVPANAANLIVWPVVEGAAASRCGAMIKSHEPLDISSETAQVVKSSAKGPFLMSRNSELQKRMIHDLSSVEADSFEKVLSEWQQLLESGAQNWQPVVIVR